jgi:beta-N-acetylhexosaminidase
MPVDRRSLKAILADDAIPYASLNTSLTAVMPAHVIYAKVDDRPAGFSRRWLKDILREQLKFEGAIISDDLSMVGARSMQGQTLSYTQAALTALDAGCDLLLLCNQSLHGGQEIDEALQGLSQALLQEQWQPSEASELRRRQLLPRTPAMSWDELMVSAAYQQALEYLP